MTEGSPIGAVLRATTTRRKFLVSTAAIMAVSGPAATLLAACGESSSTQAGQVGGELTLLEWAGYDDAKASDPFRKSHNVTVRENALTSNEEVVTKLLAGGAQNVSLVTPNIAMLPTMVAAGVAAPVDFSRLPNTGKYLPRIAEISKKFAVDGETYGAPYLWGMNALIYNEKYLPTPPQSWMDLTKPEFAKKIALTDVAADNIQCWGKVLGYDALNMTQDELDRVTNFLIDFKRSHARTFTNTYDDLAQQLAAGDIIAVASPLWIAIPDIAKKHGSDTVKWSLPKEGGQTWVDTWALPKGGSNPDTAYAWIDYMIGADAQAIVATNLQSGTVNQDAVARLDPAARNLYPYNDAAANEQAPPWALPAGTDGTVNYDAWVAAWKRVAAA